MANYTSSQDLVNDILFRAGEPTDGTSDFDSQALQYLNRAYQVIWEGGGEFEPSMSEVWWWLRKDGRGVLTLNPVIDTGTVSVTNNSASITFSSAPTPSVQGRHFKVDDHADVWVITAHNAGETNATLESVYTGDTDTAANYRVFQLDYSLASDLLYLRSPMIAYQDGRRKIIGTSLQELEERWPLQEIGSGVPKEFAPAGEQKVRFSHYGGTSSTDLIKVDYEYTYIPDDLTDDASDTPLVPRQWRHVLADMALAYLLVDKEDSKASAIAEQARRGLIAMARANRAHMMRQGGGNFGRLITRQEFRSRQLQPLRTESGLIIG